MTLYEIDSEILNCIDPETGEIVDESRLDELQMERGRKIENICCWIKNLKAEAAAIKEEENWFTKRRKSAENKAERLTKYIEGVLNGETFRTSKTVVSYRKSEAVVVDDFKELLCYSDDYLTFKDPEPNKTKIKSAIKAGVVIPGCHLEERHNISIK